MGNYQTVEVRKAVAEELRKGVPAKDVAKKFGIRPSTAYYYKYSIAKQVRPRVRVFRETPPLTIKQVTRLVSEAFTRVAKAQAFLDTQRASLAENVKTLLDMTGANKAK